MNRTDSRPRRAGPVEALLFCLAASIASAHAGAEEAPEVGATDVLYLKAGDWQRAAPERKLALSTAFMRIFCTDARMTPARLVACLDGDGRSDAVFERAIACSALLSATKD